VARASCVFPSGGRAPYDDGVPTFHTTVLQARVNATGFEVPPAVIDELGASRRPAVVVTVGGYTYRTTVGVMGGRSLIPLSAEHRAASGLAAGDEVDVTITLDLAPREVVLPAEIEARFAQDPGLRASFDALSSSRRRALVDPIEQAKTPETRARRVDKALETLRG
jgi:hypothetical protein